MEKRIVTLGKTNVSKLRKALGFKSINDAIETYGLATKARKYSAEIKKEATEMMRDQYNEAVGLINADLLKQKRDLKNQKRREKRALKRENPDYFKNILIPENITIEQKDELLRNTIYELANRFKTNKIGYLQVSSDATISLKSGEQEPFLRSRLVTYNLTDLANSQTFAWNELRPFFQIYADGNIFSAFYGSYVKISIWDNQRIPSETTLQKYRDGEVHCVIQPLINKWKEYVDNCKTKDSKQRMNRTLKKINALLIEYKTGVPEDDLEKVGKVISRCIIIHDLIGNEVKRYNTKSTKYFHFTNTRINHLETGRLTINEKPNKITAEMMKTILKDHSKKFYLCNKKDDNITSLSSSLGNWVVVNDDYEIYSDFDKQIGKKNYGLDAVKYKELNQFIRESCIVNSSPVSLSDNPNDMTNLNHADMVKAYSQHSKCKYYSGFLGHIHQYCKFDRIGYEFVKEHIGIYQISVISCKNELLKKLGIFEGRDYTLPSVEIVCFVEEYGLECVVLNGCFGSRFDFEYSEELLENKRYAIWAGKNGQETDSKRYIFKGDKKWASHLKAIMGDDKVLYINGEIIIKIPLTSYNTYHHIFAFITSYCRINMLEIMSKIKGTLKKVVLDGIYYIGEIGNVKIPYMKKEIKEHIGFTDYWFHPNDSNYGDVFEWGCYNKNFDGNCVLRGGGGSGKTYSVFTCKSLIQPLYVVPTHSLGMAMKQIYNCSYTTIHRLIGDDCVSYKMMYKEPHTIIIDELTMINKSMIIKAFEMYPNSLILLSGDVDGKQWFQCRNGKEGVFNDIFLGEGMRYVDYTVDYRSRDKELMNLKSNLRNKMKEIFEIGEGMEAFLLNNWIKENYKYIDFKTATTMHKDGDLWLSGTHNVNNKLLESGIISGYMDKHKNINFTEGEKRGSFTVHSFQGMTIPDKQVFIVLDYFEYAMLYTAISRCVNFSQITFVSYGL
jgi:hypothetical protein